MHLLLEIVEYILLTVVALGVAGETYAHLIPDRWLPLRLQSPERKKRIAEIGALLLVVALGVEIPFAVLRNRAEDAERAKQEAERAGLVARAAPRTITEEQRATILACFRDEPKGPVMVVHKHFDDEAEPYAAKISEVLSAAGFEPRKDRETAMGFGTPGVFEVIGGELPLHAMGIRRCFARIDVTLVPHQDVEHTPQGVVAIWVSSKP